MIIDQAVAEISEAYAVNLAAGQGATAVAAALILATAALAISQAATNHPQVSETIKVNAVMAGDMGLCLLVANGHTINEAVAGGLDQYNDDCHVGIGNGPLESSIFLTAASAAITADPTSVTTAEQLQVVAMAYRLLTFLSDIS